MCGDVVVDRWWHTGRRRRRGGGAAVIQNTVLRISADARNLHPAGSVGREEAPGTDEASVPPLAGKQHSGSLRQGSLSAHIKVTRLHLEPPWT